MLEAIIPDLRKPHPATAKKVRGGRTISREAVTSIVTMTDTSPTLQALKPMNTDRAREVVGSMDDYRLIAERLEKLLADVKYTAEARWAEVAAEAMHSFRIASACARDPNDADLAAHVATVRRHLGRRNAATGKRKKEPKPK